MDINDQVYQTSRADDTSAPWEGLFQQGDGSVYVMEDSSVSVAVRQRRRYGNVTVKLNGSDQPAFSNVSGVTVSTPGTSTNTVSVDSSVTAPVSAWTGSNGLASGAVDNLPTLSVAADTAAQPAEVFYVTTDGGVSSSDLTLNLQLSVPSAPQAPTSRFLTATATPSI